jgi:ABC-type uncharacterized transport system ATPase subunit
MDYSIQFIKAKKLVKKFGKFVANDNLNFEVYQVEVFGFWGLMVQGKPRQIRILWGLSEPTSGEINPMQVRCGIPIAKKLRKSLAT